MTLQEQIAWIGAVQYWFNKQEDSDNLQHIKESLRRLQQMEQEVEELKKENERLKLKPGLEKYQDFIDAYDTFCRAYIGAGAKIDGVQGKAMKAIMTYLIRESRTHDEEGALLAWKYILGNWAKLSKFIQNQTSLAQINKNLQEILTQLRRGKNEQAAKQTSTQTTRSRIIDRRKSG